MADAASVIAAGSVCRMASVDITVNGRGADGLTLLGAGVGPPASQLAASRPASTAITAAENRRRRCEDEGRRRSDSSIRPTE
jgi:hypothetical protein